MRTTGNINIYDGFNFCTTLEQSKQLLELGLNPETSDMTYLTGIRDGEEEIYGILPYKELVPACRKGNILYKNVPAWTYYKLLTLLPKEYILLLHKGVGGLLTIIKNEAFIERINKEFLIKENNSPWIRVSEQLPPEGEEVLVRLKNYNYSPRIMFYRKRDKICVEEGDVYFDCYVDGDDLWTPIPDLEG